MGSGRTRAKWAGKLVLMLVLATAFTLYWTHNTTLTRNIFANISKISALVSPSLALLEQPQRSAIHGAPAPRAARVFARDSFWYQTIPADAPLHANSARFATEFLRQKAAHYDTVYINTRSYSSPVYVVGPGVVPVPVTEWDCQHKGVKNASLGQQWRAVPIPDHAAPADGTDAEMTIYQPSTDSLWEFWKARNVAGQWQACWGGGMKHVSENPGIWERPYGTTATGLPFIGGQITADELRRGVIEHAIGISLVDLESRTIFSWPASRSDGHNPRNLPHRIPAGLRFRLDPTVDVDGLTLSRVGKTIARAAQRYGFVVWDKAGAVTLRADNPKPVTRLGRPDPYPELFESKPAYSVLEGFPWERLQFLPMHYGHQMQSGSRTDNRVPPER